MKVKECVTILTDIPTWCHETAQSLKTLGREVEVIDIRKFDWDLSDPLPNWKLIFNRIASRPFDDEPGILTMTRDLLRAVDLAGIPCVNGAACHAIGASKVLQASLMSGLEVPTPWTMAVIPENLGAKLATIRSSIPLLIKSNTGGKGRGISAPDEVSAETFAPDGMAVLQERITSGDGLIHRVEMMGGEVLYEADAPLESDTFDYCLAGMESSSLGFRREPPGEIISHCRRISTAASMDVGSVEYLIDKAGRPQFIDINPVSSWISDAVDRLGFDPVEKLVALLESRRRGDG